MCLSRLLGLAVEMVSLSVRMWSSTTMPVPEWIYNLW